MGSCKASVIRDLADLCQYIITVTSFNMNLTSCAVPMLRYVTLSTYSWCSRDSEALGRYEMLLPSSVLPFRRLLAKVKRWVSCTQSHCPWGTGISKSPEQRMLHFDTAFCHGAESLSWDLFAERWIHGPPGHHLCR
jgi:hypothetical protein